jgi:hypothetical protein
VHCVFSFLLFVIGCFTHTLIVQYLVYGTYVVRIRINRLKVDIMLNLYTKGTSITVCSTSRTKGTSYTHHYCSQDTHTQRNLRSNLSTT